MKRLLALALLPASLASAQTSVRWFATSGDVPLSTAATTVTIQQPATNPAMAYIDQVVVYCSVACSITTAVNGTAATSTAGTVQTLLPNQPNLPIPLTFWTASNVGTGTSQSGILHVSAGATVTLCFSPQCGNGSQYILGSGSGTNNNFSVITNSITGTVNITIYGRSFL